MKMTMNKKNYKMELFVSKEWGTHVGQEALFFLMCLKELFHYFNYVHLSRMKTKTRPKKKKIKKSHAVQSEFCLSNFLF